jgi:hypothetical protein
VRVHNEIPARHLKPAAVMRAASMRTNAAIASERRPTLAAALSDQATVVQTVA